MTATALASHGDPAWAHLFYPRSSGNVHLDRISRHFGTIEPDGTVLPAGIKYVMVCFTNRSGSNYLAELLASDGTYNCAGESLNWDVVVKRDTSEAGLVPAVFQLAQHQAIPIGVFFRQGCFVPDRIARARRAVGADDAAHAIFADRTRR